ncbi:MAG TPA: ribosome maturation factor RimM [Acidimicrobiales bacterium]|nr:ribosome maturation factor RimM [Acidimicrobiales bacterium]
MARIVKPHGLRGELVVERWSDLDERLAPGSALVSDLGTLVVEESRPHQGRVLVRLEGVVDREGAERLRGLVLRAEPAEQEGALWVADLVGVEVVDTEGHHLGTVQAVEANPASDLLVLEGGGLVPLRFVVDHQPGRRVTVDIPEGLLE